MKKLQGKINIKYMFVMGFIGIFLGLFLSAALMVAMADKPQLSYGKFPLFTVSGIIALLFAFWGSRMKQEEREIMEEKSLNQEGLNNREKTIAWIFSLLNPIIAGAVMYYMWKRTYPIKARQANNISLIIFLVWAIIYFFLVVLAGLHDTGNI